MTQSFSLFPPSQSFMMKYQALRREKPLFLHLYVLRLTDKQSHLLKHLDDEQIAKKMIRKYQFMKSVSLIFKLWHQWHQFEKLGESKEEIDERLHFYQIFNQNLPKKSTYSKKLSPCPKLIRITRTRTLDSQYHMKYPPIFMRPMNKQYMQDTTKMFSKHMTKKFKEIEDFTTIFSRDLRKRSLKSMIRILSIKFKS